MYLVGKGGKHHKHYKHNKTPTIANGEKLVSIGTVLYTHFPTFSMYLVGKGGKHHKHYKHNKTPTIANGEKWVSIGTVLYALFPTFSMYLVGKGRKHQKHHKKLANGEKLVSIGTASYTLFQLFLYVWLEREGEAPQTPTNIGNASKHKKACKRGEMGFDWNSILHPFPTFSVHLVGKGETTRKTNKHHKHHETLASGEKWVSIGTVLYTLFPTFWERGKNTRNTAKHQQTLRCARNIGCAIALQTLEFFHSSKAKFVFYLACGNAYSSKEEKWKDENKSNLERKHCP